MCLGRAYKYLTGQRVAFCLLLLLVLFLVLFELAGRRPPPGCVLLCQTAFR